MVNLHAGISTQIYHHGENFIIYFLKICLLCLKFACINTGYDFEPDVLFVFNQNKLTL
ncbi:hypothetical protein SAMN04488024_11264 [Pedobacter soli]|uniref:Uncharacterized protein n=1 Tax=Pedobacter soli TaxID=390242 RepID=A0A1G7AGW9_9SPHI|nr:hypothetical protein SAMN04488024_11264 [Pedobacter soli]